MGGACGGYKFPCVMGCQFSLCRGSYQAFWGLEGRRVSDAVKEVEGGETRVVSKAHGRPGTWWGVVLYAVVPDELRIEPAELAECAVCFEGRSQISQGQGSVCSDWSVECSQRGCMGVRTSKC